MYSHHCMTRYGGLLAAAKASTTPREALFFTHWLCWQRNRRPSRLNRRMEQEQDLVAFWPPFIIIKAISAPPMPPYFDNAVS